MFVFWIHFGGQKSVTADHKKMIWRVRFFLLVSLILIPSGGAREFTFKTWIAVESKSVSDFTNYLKSSVQDHFGNMNRLSNRAEPAEPRPRLQEKLHRIGGSALDWASL